MQQSSLKEKTAKGIFWSGLSNATMQLLNLVFGIFLARKLDADDYGMVGMLTIFSLIASSLQESGFIAAIANKKKASHEDYNAVFWFNILMGACLYTILFFCAPLIARFYDTPELVPLARYVFLGLLISSTGIAQHAYIFSNLMVKQKAISQIVSLVLSGIVGVALAYHGMKYWGLATQSLVYIVSTTVCYWIFSPWRPTFRFNFQPLKSMIGFSCKLLITNVFVHINNNIFSVLLGKFYTEREVGNYTQANKWNLMGYSLVSDTLHNISQPVLVKINGDVARQQNAFRKLLRFTAFIAFPVMLGLSFISHELIIITITDKWLPSVEILQLLCISGAFIPIIRLYANLLISRGKSNIYMWNTIGSCLVSLLAVIVAYPYGMYTMFVVYVSVNICWLLVWHYFLWKEIRLSLWKMLKDILPFAGVTLVSIFITGLVLNRMNVENIYLLFALKIIIVAVLYISILWIADARVLKESIRFLIRRKIQ